MPGAIISVPVTITIESDMDHLLQFFLVNQGWLLGWAVPALLLLLGVGLLLPTVHNGRHKRWLRGVLRRLGPECVEEVLLEDGVDGFAYIDRVVAGPDGLTAVTLVRNEGIIFGGEGIDLWTQVIGRRTHKFPNPLNQCRDNMLALQHNLPDTPVQGLVLFIGEASFPKGKPEMVKLPDEIPAPDHRPEIPTELRPALERLQTMARENARSYRNEVQLIHGEQPRLLRPLLGALLAIGGIGGMALAILQLG